MRGTRWGRRVFGRVTNEDEPLPRFLRTPPAAFSFWSMPCTSAERAFWLLSSCSGRMICEGCVAGGCRKG